MTDTLTYFQGLILKVIGEMGEATATEVGKRTHQKLEKSCDYSASTVSSNLEELASRGYLVRQIRKTGKAKSETLFSLTAKGQKYTSKPAS